MESLMAAIAQGSDDAKTFLNSVASDPWVSSPEQAQAYFLKQIEDWREYVKLAVREMPSIPLMSYNVFTVMDETYWTGYPNAATAPVRTPRTRTRPRPSTPSSARRACLRRRGCAS